jgi:hypothetical protein
VRGCQASGLDSNSFCWQDSKWHSSPKYPKEDHSPRSAGPIQSVSFVSSILFRFRKLFHRSQMRASCRVSDEPDLAPLGTGNNAITIHEPSPAEIIELEKQLESRRSKVAGQARDAEVC